MADAEPSPKRPKTGDADAADATSAANDCDQLLEWVAACGGAVGRIVVRSEPGLGRGLYAADDLAAGEVVFRLNPECLLTTERALGSALGQELAARCRIVKSTECDTSGVEVAAAGDPVGEPTTAEGASSAAADAGAGADARPELTERSVLYAYLLQARHCDAGAGSAERDFGPYALALPGSYSTPFSWRDELGLLPAPMEGLDHEGIDLVSELGSLGQHLSEQCAVLKAALAAGGGALQRSGKLSVREFIWAHQSYSSRCFPRSCLSSAGAGAAGVAAASEDGVLVPMLDMFNSVEDPSVNWTSNVDFDAERSEAKINCDVAKGGQIFSSFGPKGNRSLLGNYGYCRWDNKFERVALWVSVLAKLSRDPSDADANMTTLRRFQQFAGGEVGGTRFELTADEPLPERMLRAARIACGSAGEGGAEGSPNDDGKKYLRELVTDSALQVLGEDSPDELEAAAAEWRAKDDGSTVHIEVSMDQEPMELKSYACSPAACAVAYRHGQFAVLRAAERALR